MNVSRAMVRAFDVLLLLWLPAMLPLYSLERLTVFSLLPWLAAVIWRIETIDENGGQQ